MLMTEEEATREDALGSELRSAHATVQRRREELGAVWAKVRKWEAYARQAEKELAEAEEYYERLRGLAGRPE